MYTVHCVLESQAPFISANVFILFIHQLSLMEWFSDVKSPGRKVNLQLVRTARKSHGMLMSQVECECWECAPESTGPFQQFFPVSSGFARLSWAVFVDSTVKTGADFSVVFQYWIKVWSICFCGANFWRYIFYCHLLFTLLFSMVWQSYFISILSFYNIIIIS